MITISGALKIGILAGTRRYWGRCRLFKAARRLRSWSFVIACANGCHLPDAITLILKGSARRGLNVQILTLFNHPCPFRLRIFPHPFIQALRVTTSLPDWGQLCWSHFWPLGHVLCVLCAWLRSYWAIWVSLGQSFRGQFRRPHHLCFLVYFWSKFKGHIWVKLREAGRCVRLVSFFQR